MILQDLQSVINQNRATTGPLYLRNLLKETLQFYTLSFIYGSSWGESFLFKGGTALRICFDLPRLSEDLDFDVKNYINFDLGKFTKDLDNFFRVKWQQANFSTRVAGNNRQIFLQFPVLKELGLAFQNESDVLFLRLDLAPTDSEIYTEEISVKTTKNLSFIVKRYSMPDLFASKIAAILNHTFKGRDYFDLIWFLEKGIVPNFERLEDLLKKSKKEILMDLQSKVELVKPEYLKEDLNPLFPDQKFVNDFCQNFQKLYQTLAKF